MTSPASFNTADRIIRFAMTNCGKLAAGSDPTSDDYAMYMPRLNDLINYYQIKGLKLWLQLDVPVSLTAGKNNYKVGPGNDVNMTKPTRLIDDCYYADVNLVRRPVVLISSDEWNKLSNINNLGAINSIYVDKQQNYLSLNVWQPPDATTALGLLHIILQQQTTNLVNITDAMNFPQEWFMLLHWGLANQISTGQPQSVIDRCKMMEMEYMEALEGWDVEDASTRFTPDTQGMAYTSGFR